MADALTKRDIEMIFRAETQSATRPIQDLKKGVADLSKTLAEQVKAAERGEGSIEALAKTVKDLKAAQDELGTARSLLTSLNSQVAALEKAQQKAKEAADKYEALKTQADAADKPTKRLSQSLEAAGRAASAAAEKEALLTAQVAESRTQIEGIIGPVDNFQAAFRDVAVSSKTIAQGLAVAGTATEEYKVKLAGVSEAEKKLAENDAFQAAGKRAGLLQSQIDYLSQFQNRVQLLAEAERELQQQNTNFDKALSAQSAKEGAANVSVLRSQFEAAFAEQERLERVGAFQKVAQDAKEAASNVDRFAATIDSSAANATRLSEAIFKIVAPSASAASNLQEVGAAVDKAEAALGGGKLRIAQYQEALNGVDQAIAGLNRQAAQVDGYRKQEAALQSATVKFQELQTQVTVLADKMLTADAPSGEMVRDLKNLETALTAAGSAMQREDARLQELAASLSRAGIDVKQLDNVEKQLITTAERAAKAQAQLSAKTGRGGAGGGFLGLNPYELQNLSYQVNDVFTSLASGIPIQQVIFQQGGQIAQLFPGMFASIAAQLGLVIPLLGLAAAGFLSISRALSQIQQQREAKGFLAGLGDDFGYTSEQIVKAQKNLRDFGASADDAKKAVQTFVKEGINPKQLDDFSRAALNASEYLGISLPDAAKKMTEAFRGGKDEVLKLNEEFPFLSKAEYDHIRAMKDSTDQSEIRRIAFEAFFKKMSEGAQNLEGPWAQSTRTFSKAWNDMLDAIAATGVIDIASKALSNLTLGLAGFINLFGEYRKQLNNNLFGAGAPRSLSEAFFGNPRQDKRTFSQLVDAAIKDTASQMQKIQNRFSAQSAPGDPGKGRKEQDKQDKAAEKEAERLAKKRKREAEELARQLESESDQLTSSLDRMTAAALKAQNATLDQELANARKAIDEQYKPLYDRLNDFTKKFGAKTPINGISQAAYRQQLDANKAILAQEAQLKVYEEDVNKALAERQRQLDAIQTKVESGQISPAQGFQETLDVTSKLNPLLDELINKALQFSQGLAPSPETLAFIAQLQRAQASTPVNRPPSEDPNVKKAALAERATAEQKINDLIAARNGVVEAQNQLLDLNLTGVTEAEAAKKQAYEDTNASLTDQINKLEALIELQHQVGAITPEEYAKAKASVDLFRNSLVYVSDETQAINDTAEHALVEGFSNFFTAVGQGFANLITGARSFKHVIGDLGKAALSFAASFLQAIAQIIIKLLALRVIKSLLGPGGFAGFLGIHGGGKVGDSSKGRMTLRRQITPDDIANMGIYHGGGTVGAGLKSDEQLAVLRKGEQVKTEEQQRWDKRRLAAASDGGTKSIRNILVVGDDQVAAAMQGPAGEQVVVSHMIRNKLALKQALDN